MKDSLFYNSYNYKTYSPVKIYLLLKEIQVQLHLTKGGKR